MLNAPKRFIALASMALWACGPAFAAGGEGAGEPASTLELTYDLYAGGVPLGRVDFSARLRGDNYTAISTLETVGLANALWRARIEGTSFGVLDGESLRPTTYEAFSIHSATGWNRQQVTLSYGPDGIPEVTPNPPYTRRIELDDDVKRNTFDPVSALIFFTTSYEADLERPCAQVAPVFDGQRRYTISLNFVRNTDVDLDSGLYRGPVEVCRLRYSQVAGADQTVFEDADIPNIFGWVTSLQSVAVPERRYLLPLRIWAETDYGILVALASRVVLDGSELTSLN